MGQAVWEAPGRSQDLGRDCSRENWGGAYETQQPSTVDRQLSRFHDFSPTTQQRLEGSPKASRWWSEDPRRLSCSWDGICLSRRVEEGGGQFTKAEEKAQACALTAVWSGLRESWKTLSAPFLLPLPTTSLGDSYFLDSFYR